jgi:hypothetical protein
VILLLHLQHVIARVGDAAVLLTSALSNYSQLREIDDCAIHLKHLYASKRLLDSSPSRRARLDCGANHSNSVARRVRKVAVVYVECVNCAKVKATEKAKEVTTYSKVVREPASKMFL